MDICIGSIIQIKHGGQPGMADYPQEPTYYVSVDRKMSIFLTVALYFRQKLNSKSEKVDF